jgi:hypothetical protein
MASLYGAQYGVLFLTIKYLTFGTLFITRRSLVSEGQSQFTEFLHTLIVRRFGYEDERRIADAACPFLGHRHRNRLPQIPGCLTAGEWTISSLRQLPPARLR